jgi:hypothetical protein
MKESGTNGHPCQRIDPLEKINPNVNPLPHNLFVFCWLSGWSGLSALTCDLAN